MDPIDVLSGRTHLTREDFLNLSDEDLDRLHRAQSVYGDAMRAMEFYESLPPCTSCGGECGYADEKCPGCGKSFCAHCLVGHEEEEC